MKENRKTLGKNTVLTGIVFLILTATCITIASVGPGPVVFLAYVFMVTFMFYHGSQRYGWKRTLLFIGIVAVVSWSYESLSILTGFPFGHYNYTENFVGPWIGLVPFMIMPAYLAMGYMSWTIGSILLGRWDSSLQGSDIILQPLLSSFVMVMWDLTMDPMSATIGKYWDWHEGGAYFGVPFGNFMGWFLCVFTFYFIFSLILRFGSSSRPNVTITNKAYWILPALMYMTRIIQNMVGALFGSDVEVVSNEGHVWWTGDIFQSLLLVSVFTMVFVVFYAILRVSRSKELAEEA